jgi:hypothetical protein
MNGGVENEAECKHGEKDELCGEKREGVNEEHRFREEGDESDGRH